MGSDVLDEVREGVLYLEALCDERLDEVPVHQRDQVTAGIREMFGNFGVDLDDPNQAAIAVVSGRITAGFLMSNNPNSGKATAHLLRYLLDKSDGVKDHTRRRRFRMWLSEKIMPNA